MFPGTDSVAADKGIGPPVLWPLDVVLGEELGDSVAFCWDGVIGVVPIFEMIFMRLI